MSVGNDGRKRVRLGNGENELIEDTTALQLRILREVQAITIDIDDPALLRYMMPRLTVIVEAAEKTREMMIQYREKRQEEMNGEKEAARQRRDEGR